MSARGKPEYFEDFITGDQYHLGSFTLTEAEIIEFAERYDPQPFHTDPAAAADSFFGGIIASGWQTGSCVMRLMVDNFIAIKASLGSPGLDNIRWVRPVRPGVEYTATLTVTDTRPSSSKPDRGIIRTEVDLVDPDGQLVYQSIGMVMYLRRDNPGSG